VEFHSDPASLPAAIRIGWVSRSSTRWKVVLGYGRPDATLVTGYSFGAGQAGGGVAVPY
jgi:hypothetical protein